MSAYDCGNRTWVWACSWECTPPTKACWGRFTRPIDRIAGSTQLQVSAGEAGFDEDVLDKIRDVPGVRAAAPVIEASISTGEGNVLLLGVDMLGDRSLRNYDFEDTDAAIDDPLVFLAQADSLMITRPFAQKRGLKIGSRISLRTMAGDQTFTVRGIMKPGGLANAFGGDLAIMDIYAAQKMLGRGRKFDRVDLALDDGVTLEQAEAKLRLCWGLDFKSSRPARAANSLKQRRGFIPWYRTSPAYLPCSLGCSSSTTHFPSRFHSAVPRSEFCAPWARRAGRCGLSFCWRAPSRAFWERLPEWCSGMLMARAMAGYIGSLLEQIYGSAQQTGELAIEPKLFAGGDRAWGWSPALIAAWLPANAAASVDPVKALQKGRTQAHHRRRESHPQADRVRVPCAFDRRVDFQPRGTFVLRRLCAGGGGGDSALPHADFVALPSVASTAGAPPPGGRVAGRR